ncbi:response regulator [Rhizobium sp. Root1220]|uniref:response regulator n=1 Tax=Rhizobium sp. Root1220 TaxID=1736432 RepID=UPI001FCDBF8E|nr:response regulator [Rhizobium sp. Root1220]
MSVETAATEAPQPLLILLVADEDLILMNTTDMFETMGHVVLEATSAEEALTLFDRERVDVLLTHHGLPGMSGAILRSHVAASGQNWGSCFALARLVFPR